MRYDTEELRWLAQRMLSRARKNLRKYGFVPAVGLAVLPDGSIETFAFQFETLEEKRALQLEFQIRLTEWNAQAAVLISETWVKFADDGPFDHSDLELPVQNMPGRKDAIMVEAGSPFGRVVIVQTFAKLGANKVSFDHPREFTPLTGELTSEFFDAIWPVRGEGGHTWQ